MKKLGATLLIVLVLGTQVRAEEDTPDLSGVYKYGESKLTLTKRGEIYEYEEDHGKDGLWVGVGIYKDGVLAIAWQKSNGANLGVSHMKVEKGDKGPKLVANWANYPLPGKEWSNKFTKYDPPLVFEKPVDK